ncbi:MAG: hypothetical protein ACYTAF_04705 [Planctomycetota bacterium]|jgi:hypothetical protein
MHGISCDRCGKGLLVLIACVLAYLLSWAATALIGTRQVEASLEEHLRWDDEERRGIRLDTFDPWESVPSTVEHSNWTFIGNSVAPCPFVVGVDCATGSSHFEHATHAWYVWFFGLDYMVGEQMYWHFEGEPGTGHGASYGGPLGTALTRLLVLNLPMLLGSGLAAFFVMRSRRRHNRTAAE